MSSAGLLRPFVIPGLLEWPCVMKTKLLTHIFNFRTHGEVSVDAIVGKVDLPVGAAWPAVAVDHVHQGVGSLHLPRVLQDAVNPLRPLIVHAAPTH